jgi:anti-anti-sigma factor
VHLSADSSRRDGGLESDAPRLDVISVMGDGFVRLELHGELDLTNVAELTRPLLTAELATPALIVLDLCHVTLLDAAGLRVFLDAARRAELGERRFAIARPDQETARVLRLTGLDESIEVLSQLPS